MLKNNKFTNLALLTVLYVASAALFMSADYLMAAWQNPPSNPPSSNVAAPVNVGGSSQIKAGGLGVGALDVAGNAAVSGNMQVNGSLRANYVRSSGDIRANNNLLADNNLLASNHVRAGGQMRSWNYCNYEGENCFRAGDVVKKGDRNETRSSRYCDEDGNNCFEANDVGDTGSRFCVVETDSYTEISCTNIRAMQRASCRDGYRKVVTTDPRRCRPDEGGQPYVVRCTRSICEF